MKHSHKQMEVLVAIRQIQFSAAQQKLKIILALEDDSIDESDLEAFQELLSIIEDFEGELTGSVIQHFGE